MEPAVAVADEHYQTTEDRTDWGVSAGTGRYRLARSPSSAFDHAGQRFDRALADPQAGLCLSAWPIDDGRPPTSAVGLSQESRSQAVSGPHSASGNPQIVGRALHIVRTGFQSVASDRLSTCLERSKSIMTVRGLVYAVDLEASVFSAHFACEFSQIMKVKEH